MNKQFNPLVIEKGSFTVEASLIFPVILLSITAVIYICAVLYQKVYIQALTDTAVQRGCAVWNNSNKSTSLGYIEKSKLKSGGLYWRIFDAQKAQKTENIRDFINTRINRFNILHSRNEIRVEIVDKVVYKKLVVTVDSKYKIPAGKFLNIFGMDEFYTVTTRSEGVVSEPVEFIRNADFILDVEKELEEDYPEYGRVVGKIRGIMSSMEQKITDLRFIE